MMNDAKPKNKTPDEKNLRKVRCPQCGHPAIFAPANPFRPFCSERCKLLDLGQWADETYKVPAEDSSSITLNSTDDSDEI